MTVDMLIVFGLLALIIILFVSDRLRLDLVAMMGLLALMLLDILTPQEALAGFADPVVLIIAGLFIVGGALVQTGVADRMGYWLGRVAGTRESTLIMVIMAVAALLSGFMSSTGTTAVLLPIVVSLARDARISPSKLLIPLALASLLGGMLTLIGTPPNIVVSNQLVSEGLAPFGFFSFTPVGLIMLLIGIGFMVTIGRFLLPDRQREEITFDAGESSQAGTHDNGTISLKDLAQTYHLTGNLFRLRIRRSSPLLGRTLAEADLHNRYNITVLQIQSRADKYSLPGPPHPVTADTVLEPFDILHVQGTPENVRRLARELDFAITADESAGADMVREMGMVEVLLTPRSRLIGRTLSEVSFRAKYGLTVLGIRRLGELLEGKIIDIPLQFGDMLLVEGTWDRVRVLRRDARDFIVVGQPAEMAEAERPVRLGPLAVAIMLGMLILMTFEIVPTVTAVLLAAVALVLSGCLTMEDAYRNINWESVVLIAGMLPVATALQKTGGMAYIANGLTTSFGEMGPLAVMAGLFVLTAFFSQFISNTATAVLVAPIALQTAVSLGIQPQPLLMAVAVAASTSFATPVATPVNTLVLGPGGYRFADYAKVGISLQLIILVATLLFVPLLFPF
jgi:di/tricarboxylate transporter